MDRSKDSGRKHANSGTPDPGEGAPAQPRVGNPNGAEPDDLGDLFSDGDPLGQDSNREVSAPLKPRQLSSRITQALAELDLPRSRSKDGPNGPVRVLHDRKVVLVDDSAEVLRTFVPALITATNGTAAFVHHKGEKTTEIITRILALKPELVLLDGQLSGGIRGWDVCQQLSKIKPDLPVIGFSSDPGYERQFLSNAAAGFVAKKLDAVAATIAEVAAQSGIWLDGI